MFFTEEYNTNNYNYDFYKSLGLKLMLDVLVCIDRKYRGVAAPRKECCTVQVLIHGPHVAAPGPVFYVLCFVLLCTNSNWFAACCLVLL